jgi:hypothetical protein
MLKKSVGRCLLNHLLLQIFFQQYSFHFSGGGQEIPSWAEMTEQMPRIIDFHNLALNKIQDFPPLCSFYFFLSSSSSSDPVAGIQRAKFCP